MDDDTNAYYRANADTFFADTLGVDMAPLYARFLPHLPVGGRILDAGCGSGRDARAFRDRGDAVTTFDASAELAALAAVHLGQPVQVLRFQDLEWTQAMSEELRTTRAQPPVTGATRPEADALAGGDAAFGAILDGR